MTQDYRPRLTVDITPEQYKKLQELLQHGMRVKLFGLLIDEVISMLEKLPPDKRVKLLMLADERAIRLREFLPSLAEADGDSDGRP